MKIKFEIEFVKVDGPPLEPEELAEAFIINNEGQELDEDESIYEVKNIVRVDLPN